MFAQETQEKRKPRCTVLEDQMAQVIKITVTSQPVWLSWLEHHPLTKGLPIRFAVRAHAWVGGSISSPGAYNSCLGAYVSL